MKCRYEHDGDCCNSGATQYMCKCKKPCYTIIPITNADRIRAMTDEELGKFLSIYGCPCHARDCRASCEDCVIDWLQQPAEGGMRDG